MSTKPDATPYDTGNTLLAETPAQMTAIPVNLPDGIRLAVTIRTSSATVTAMLSKADAGNWAALLRQAAAKMPANGKLIKGHG